MKKSIMVVLAIGIMAVLLVPTLASAAPKEDKGNGAPNGPHWNLNIIGMTNDKNMPEGLGGNVIFVAMNKDESKVTTRINLVEGEEFAVLDKDGTDKSATLQLMDPYLVDGEDGLAIDGQTPEYKIYIRALGKPGGEATITTGFIDEYGGEWLSLDSVSVERKGGQSRFSDQTLPLTTILVDMTDDGVDNPLRYNLFGNELWEYFWDYDNNGLKLLQMRIYLC